MTYTPQITTRNLSYKNLINNFSLSLGCVKTAIVGKNGIGKTTFLRLIMGELSPSLGVVERVGSFAYSPQTFFINKYSTVAELLGVAEKLAALDRISQGSVVQSDFDIVANDWDLHEKIARILKGFDLDLISLNSSLKNLSGGELTRLLLANTFLSDADFLIFDEPTNNLDATSRKLLYSAITNWKKGVIVVSHDRELLLLMDKIVEITTKGYSVYGGGYDLYLQQKKVKRQAQVKELQDAKKSLQKTKNSIQKSREFHEQRKRKGKSARRDGSQAKIILNGMKERSGKTQNKLAIKEKFRMDAAGEVLQAVKSKMDEDVQMDIVFSNISVPARKLMINFESVSFAYPGQETLIEKLSFTVQGPERLAINGVNGSGKTTLVKLIMGQLLPVEGRVTVGVKNIGYLDQVAEILLPDLSILGNFRRINPEVCEFSARQILANFLFRREKVFQAVSELSGGEKLRAALACVLPVNNPPQLLILDEPTNHLDLESISVLEQVLNSYCGALIVISHDKTFLKNIGIEKSLSL